MIPKIIHYCWFGRGQMSPLAHKCLLSWRKHLPDYKLMLWNEENFDLSLFPYAKEAYREKKFAFVTDVCRLYALQQFGGVYMDTDVEILKPLASEFLSKQAFSGFEDNNFLPTGLMASIPNGQWVSDLLEYYVGRSFYLADGGIDTTTNTQVITSYMSQHKGILLENTFQEIPDYCTLYPSDFFCPKSWQTSELNITNNTYCIHHFAGSWRPSSLPSFKFRTARFLFGEKLATWGLEKYNKRKRGNIL